MGKPLTRFVLDDGAVVHGPHHPMLASQITAGGQIVLSNSLGRLIEVAVNDVSSGEPREMVRLFTPSGDCFLPPEVKVVLKSGPARASDIRVGDKVEVLEPGAIQYKQPSGQSTERSSILGCLPSGVARIPANLPDVTDARRSIEKVLKSSGVSYRETVGDRWIAFQWTPIPYVGLGFGDWAAESDSLMALTAWSDGGELVSRTPAAEIVARRHLLALLFASKRHHSVRWVPKFAPADCYVSLADKSQQAFQTVSGSASAEGTPLVLDVDGDGYLSLGRFLIAPSKT